MPPSPSAPRFLVGEKLTAPASPMDRIVAPVDDDPAPLCWCDGGRRELDPFEVDRKAARSAQYSEQLTVRAPDVEHPASVTEERPVGTELGALGEGLEMAHERTEPRGEVVGVVLGG